MSVDSIFVTVLHMLSKNVHLNLFADLKSLFNALKTFHSTTEMRFSIDLIMLCQSYEKCNISEVVWTPGPYSPADLLTKPAP